MVTQHQEKREGRSQDCSCIVEVGSNQFILEQDNAKLQDKCLWEIERKPYISYYE